MRVKNLILPILGVSALAGAPTALATTFHSGGSGGAGVAAVQPVSTPSHPTVSGSVARIIHGVAYAPANAPIQVQRAIWAGNKIRHKPYI